MRNFVYYAEDLVAQSPDLTIDSASLYDVPELDTTVDILYEALWFLLGRINLPENGVHLGPAKITIELLAKPEAHPHFTTQEFGEWGVPLTATFNEGDD